MLIQGKSHSGLFAEHLGTSRVVGVVVVVLLFANLDELVLVHHALCFA